MKFCTYFYKKGNPIPTWKYNTVPEDPFAATSHQYRFEYLIPGIDDKLANNNWLTGITYMDSCMSSILWHLYHEMQLDDYLYLYITANMDDNDHYNAMEDTEDLMLIDNLRNYFCELIPAIVNARIPYAIAKEYLSQIITMEYLCKKFFYLDHDKTVIDPLGKSYRIVTHPSEFRYENYLPYKAYRVQKEYMQFRFADHDDMIERHCYDDMIRGYPYIFNIGEYYDNPIDYFRSFALTFQGDVYDLIAPNPKLIDVIVYSTKAFLNARRSSYETVCRHYFYNIMRALNLAFFNYLAYPDFTQCHFTDDIWNVVPIQFIENKDTNVTYLSYDIRKFIMETTKDFAEYAKSSM